MPFSLNYKDYLANAQGLNSSETPTAPMSEADWNAIPDDQKWGLLGMGSQGITVNQFDPRYAGMGVSGGDNRSINVMPGTFNTNTNDKGVQRFNDSSQVNQGQGYYTSATSNTTSDAQKQGGMSDLQLAIMAASLFGGGALSAGALGGAGATGMTAMDTAVGGGFGTGTLGAGGTGAAFGAGAGGAAGAAGGSAFDFSPMEHLQPTNVGNLGDFNVGSGGLLGSGSSPGGMLGEGGLDPETLAGNGGMGVGQNGIGPGSLGQIAQGTINNPSSLLGRGGDLLSNAGSWAMRNPLQAYGLVRSGVGALTGGGSNTSGSGGSSKSSNGTGVSNIQRPQFIQNPYLAQQLHQRGYQ